MKTRHGSATMFLAFLVVFSCVKLSAIHAFAQSEKLPLIRHEFRAVWIATVDNIDFPSSKNLTTRQQKDEIIKILDLVQKLNFNTVIFQVRPHADAIYDSKIEPWSEYLNGVQGKRPTPFYDPLKFIIDEAHRRGILVHAWFNPYRAGHPAMKGKFADNHISERRPELVKKYGKYLWLDPGEKEVQSYSLGVILDVVKRYDIDGVHFDDYFYPYPEKDTNGEKIPFPDEPSWKKYLQTGGKLARDDWRRKNVNDFVQKVSVQIKKIKPGVMFGISPFGIWQPVPEKEIIGFNSYTELYADSRKWLQQGWVDYFAPQLYWSSVKTGQKFPVLLDWWKAQNTKGRHLWAGIATYRIGTREDFTTEEIIHQIDTTRNAFGPAAGAIHFSLKPISQNRGNIQNALCENIYSNEALIPTSSWLIKALPSAPVIKFSNGRIVWQVRGRVPVFKWIVYWKNKNGWSYKIFPSEKTSYQLRGQDKIIAAAVSSVDRLGNKSKPTIKIISDK